MKLLRIFRCGHTGVSLGLTFMLVMELLGVSFFTVLVFPTSTEAAVVTIDTTTSTTARTNNNTGTQTVFTTDQIGYSFYRDSSGRCVYRKTIDAGATWGATVIVDNQTDCIRINVWYDQWTPGDTGSSIHILTMDTSDDDLFYNRLDTSSDTLLLGTAAVNASVNSGQTPTFSAAINLQTITKATDGELYAAVNDNGDSYAISCSASCGTGTNWTEVGTSPFNTRNDHNILMPLAAGDIMVINRDISANLIRTKVWNGTAWSGSWTIVETSLTESSEYDGGMSATIDQATGYVYLAYATDNNNLTDSNDDIQTAVYDGSAWTTMTDVITNVAGRGLTDVAIAIDQNNSDVYVAYTIQDTGGTANTGNIYYKESTDGMTTWSSEQGPVNTTPGDLRKPSLDPSNSERLYVTWWESSVDDRFGETLDNIGPDTTVSAIGTQTVNLRAATTDNYVGATLVIESLLPNTLSAITLTEIGSIDASTGLENIKLFYDLDTSAPYDCVSESYAGTELQFGSTDADGFSSANGTSTFSGAGVSLSPTQTFCGYVVVDTTNAAADGSEVQIEINDPVNDVTVTGSDPYPDTVIALAGTTTIVSPDLTQVHYHWRNDDGSETTATSFTGNSEDSSIAALSKLSPLRLRVGVSVEGSTSSDAIQYQLEFTELIGSCSDSVGWTAVDSAADAFEIFNSSNLTDGGDTTNIAVSTGGVTDENTTFLTPNGAIQDVGDITSSIILETTEFLELEYSIVATSSAVEGTSYCFRLTDNGTALGNYDIYAQATINADITASTTGIHTATVDIPTTDVYFGGTLFLKENVVSHSVTAITLTEIGSIDASTGLENIKLFYDLDTSAPYDCVSESYAGTELQFGSTDADGFSSANGTSTFSGGQLITSTQTMCMYVVADVTEAVVSGETVQFSINSAVDDVIAGGASISPSAPVAISGSTTALGSVLTQTHYHWRNDDGSEALATSASGDTEDTPVTDFQTDSPIRLRVSVSNEGATSSAEAVYVLEYGELVSTCSAIGVWTEVSDAADDAWDEFDSTHLTHGANTTNIFESLGGVTDENVTFVGTNSVRETNAVSASTTLSESEFLELEFSLTSTLLSTNGETYCFRLVANGEVLDAYDQYPEISIAAKRDYVTQRGNIVLSGTSAVITAGVDYVAPASTSYAFIRITNTSHTGAGDIVGGGAQDVEEITAYIENPDNLGTSITFARDRNLNETFIDWEIIEFIGKSGTDNEMIVRDVDTVTMSSVQTVASGTSVTVADDADVVVFITGLSGNETANDMFSIQVTADWDDLTDTPVFTREDTGSADVDVSYAIVEFVGMNWKVQRVEHAYTAANIIETEVMAPVTSLTQAFIHAQKRVGANTQVASLGHEVYLSSIGAVSFVLPSGASVAVNQVSVAWVIENVQTGVGAMKVERQNGSTRSGAEPLTISAVIADTLDAVNNSSIFGNSSARGTNNAHPRSIAGLRIVSPTTYEIWRSDTGTDLLYRTELVQWPVADLAYRQNYYRFYTDNSLLTPTDAWPEGVEDLGENTSITDADKPPGIGDILRLRMTVQARNANWPADFTQFKLQYAERVTTCTAIGTWNDLGDTSSTTIWRGFVGAGTTDGTDLSGDPPTPGDLLMSVADVAGTHEHQNNTATNTHLAFDGEDVEFDWYIQHNGATADTPYCFRMTEAGGTALSGYLQYPQLLTADFTPVIKDWRWYEDPENETPSSALAAVNTAPTDILSSTTLALRVVVPEDKSVSADNVKFKLQFSEDITFSSVTDVVASSSCVNTSEWCYIDGTATDNATITTEIVGTADACAGGVGVGCGTHNNTADFAGGHSHGATDAQEYSFTLQSALLRPNAVYYFRLYDVGRARPVELDDSSAYPSLVGEGASLVFTIGGLPNGTSTAGITTAATTSAAAIDFGVLPVSTEVNAAQRLTIDTNAVEGYRVWKFARQNLTNGGGLEIPSVSSTNALPESWVSACVGAATGCVGYHSTDATLGGGSARFAPLDTYAALHVSPEEIMYSSLPANESHDVVYRVFVTEDQPAGEYETNIVYIATPVF